MDFGVTARPLGEIVSMRAKRADGRVINLGRPDVLIPWRFWLFNFRRWLERRGL